MTSASRLLIFVDPHSCRDEADLVLGQDAASDVRRRLVERLRSWDGALLVVDRVAGEGEGGRLYLATRSALVTAAQKGFSAARIRVPEGRRHADVVVRQAKTFGSRMPVVLVGGWVPGWVSDVHEALTGAGITTEIDHAATCTDNPSPLSATRRIKQGMS